MARSELLVAFRRWAATMLRRAATATDVDAGRRAVGSMSWEELVRAHAPQLLARGGGRSGRAETRADPASASAETLAPRRPPAEGGSAPWPFAEDGGAGRRPTFRPGMGGPGESSRTSGPPPTPPSTPRRRGVESASEARAGARSADGRGARRSPQRVFSAPRFVAAGRPVGRDPLRWLRPLARARMGGAAALAALGHAPRRTTSSAEPSVPPPLTPPPPAAASPRRAPAPTASGPPFSAPEWLARHDAVVHEAPGWGDDGMPSPHEPDRWTDAPAPWPDLPDASATQPDGPWPALPDRLAAPGATDEPERRRRLDAERWEA